MPEANAVAPPARPIEVFYAYSHKDENLRDELETHLSILKRRGIISCWHDRRISGGTEWDDKIDEHLNRADIILLLVSADFIASDYCYEKEMTRAMERHESKEACVIPVILRACDWNFALFSKLQAFPRDGKPVVSWLSRDEAFKDVSVGIRRVAEELQRSLPKPAVERETALPAPTGLPPIMRQSRSPGQDPRGLLMWGPRIEVEIGPPILRGAAGRRSPSSGPSGAGTFLRMPALIDTGAGRTVLTPAAVNRAGLLKVDVTRLARAGGINEDAGYTWLQSGFHDTNSPRLRSLTLSVANCRNSQFNAFSVEIFSRVGGSTMTVALASGRSTRRTSRPG